MQQEYAKVRLLDAPWFLDQEYDYQVPEDLLESVLPGSFVTVPFGGGNRRRMGLVTSLAEDSSYEGVKPILSVTTPRISLSEEMLGLVCFLREMTLCTTGDAVHAMIPAGALASLTECYAPTGKSPSDVRHLSTDEAFLLAHLQKVGSAGLGSLRARFGSETETYLQHLMRLKLVTRELRQKNEMAEKEEVSFELAVSEADAQALVAGEVKGQRLGEKQRAALALILSGTTEEKALRAAGITKAQTDALLKKALIERRAERIWRDRRTAPAAESTVPREFTLNEEQAAAHGEIQRLSLDGAPHAVLLHGVTGSGKTPVMLKTIDGMLARGKGVIVLLPEIALTPQSLAIFCSRYGERVAVMHSGLSVGERLDTYHRILSGEADVVVGTRSAVFAPVKNLGLIAIDEEHEHTYKSDMNPKYHARDVARWRCAHNKALLLLCSATPSLESYKRATEWRYTLLKMTNRHAGARLPEVTVADMRGESTEGNLSPIGGALTASLTENAAAGNQSILFLNRRGYNHAVSCRSCGEALTCPSCSVSLTYHTAPHSYEEGYLVCHFCGRRQRMPEKCPSCGSPHLHRLGYGTQRVEQELGALLPGKRILRMDTDTTGTRHSYDEMLGAFRRHEADVLLGTQMVTKGHDFPDVTLVGVLMADASLYLDDYRAAERTFALLTQVIGRAGRAGKAGRAIIQTNNPDHEVITLACRQDYESFFQREIRLRRLLVFPPFCDIVLLTLSHFRERELFPAAKALSDTLARLLGERYKDVKLIAFGPFEAPVYRAEGKYRLRMVIKCALNKETRSLFGELLATFGRQGTATPLLSIDFNPSSL